MQNQTGSTRCAKVGPLSRRLMSAYMKTYMDTMIQSTFETNIRSSVPKITDENVFNFILNYKRESLVKITEKKNESGSNSKEDKLSESDKTNNSYDSMESPIPSTSKVSTYKPKYKRESLVKITEKTIESGFSSKEVKLRESAKNNNSSKGMESPIPSASKVSTCKPNYKRESLVKLTEIKKESRSSSKEVKLRKSDKTNNTSKGMESLIKTTSKVSTYKAEIKRKPLILKIERNSEYEYISKKVKPRDSEKFKVAFRDIKSPTPSTSKVSTYIPGHKRKSSVDITKKESESKYSSKKIKLIENDKFKSSSDGIETPIPSTSKVSTFIPNRKRKSSVIDTNKQSEYESSSKKVKSRECDKTKNSYESMENHIPSTSKVPTSIPNRKRKSSVIITDKQSEYESSSKKVKSRESDKKKIFYESMENPIPSTSKVSTYIPESLVKITEKTIESGSSSKEVKLRESDKTKNSSKVMESPIPSTSKVSTCKPNSKRESLVKLTEMKNESGSSSKGVKLRESDKTKNSSKVIESPIPSISKVSTCKPNSKRESLVKLTEMKNESGSSSKGVKIRESDKTKNSSKVMESPIPSISKVSTCKPNYKREWLVKLKEKTNESGSSSKEVKLRESNKTKNSSKVMESPIPSISKVSTCKLNSKRESLVKLTEMKNESGSSSKGVKLRESDKTKNSSKFMESPIPSISKVSTCKPNYKREWLVKLKEKTNESGSSSKGVKLRESDKTKNSSKVMESPIPSTSKVSTCKPNSNRESLVKLTEIKNESGSSSKGVKLRESDRIKNSSKLMESPIPSTSKVSKCKPNYKRESMVKIPEMSIESGSSSKEVKLRETDKTKYSSKLMEIPISSTSRVSTCKPNSNRESLVKLTEIKNESGSSSKGVKLRESDRIKNSFKVMESPIPSTSKVSKCKPNYKRESMVKIPEMSIESGSSSKEVKLRETDKTKYSSKLMEIPISSTSRVSTCKPNYKSESMFKLIEKKNESGSSSKEVNLNESDKSKNSSKVMESPIPSTSKVSTCKPNSNRESLVKLTEIKNESGSSSKGVKLRESDRIKNSFKVMESPIPSTSKVSKCKPNYKRESMVKIPEMSIDSGSSSKEVKLRETDKTKYSSKLMEIPISSTSRVSTCKPNYKSESLVKLIEKKNESGSISKEVNLSESDKSKNSSKVMESPIHSTSKVFTCKPNYKRESLVKITKKTIESGSSSKDVKLHDSDKTNNSSKVMDSPIPAASNVITYIPNYKRESLVKLAEKTIESGSSSKEVKFRETDNTKNSSNVMESPIPSTSKVCTSKPNYKRESLVKISENTIESGSSSNNYHSNNSDKLPNSFDGIENPGPSTSYISNEINNISNTALEHSYSINENKYSVKVRDISKLMVTSNIKRYNECFFPEKTSIAFRLVNIEQYSLSEIDRLYYRYFNIILIEDVTIIANIMHIIEILNEHDPPNKSISYFKAKIKQIDSLENKIVEMLNVILRSFEESHRLLIFSMFYLGILKVIRILKKDQFQIFAIFRQFMPILWSCFNKKSFTQRDFRFLFISEQFRSLVVYLVNKIYDNQVMDHRPDKRLQFFFITSIRGEEYFQSIIDIIQANDNIEDMGDMEILINTAKTQYYNSRPVDRICSSSAVLVHNSNRTETFFPSTDTSNTALSGVTDQTRNTDFQSQNVTNNRHTVIQFARPSLAKRHPHLMNCLRNDVIIVPPSTQNDPNVLVQRSNVALNPVEFSQNTNSTVILNNIPYHLVSIPSSPIQRASSNTIAAIQSVPNHSNQANDNEPIIYNNQINDYISEEYSQDHQPE